MEQSLLIVSSPSDSNNKFGLGADTNDDDDEFWLFDDDNEEYDDIEEEDAFSSKLYDGWDYKKDFGEDAWKKLYRDREARQRFILLRLFTMRLPNIPDQAKMDYLSHFLDLIHLVY